jgi:hypothetical protein
MTRKRIALAALLGVMSLCLSPAARAATYYVDYEGGSDQADGRSSEKPFKHCPGDPGAKDASGAATLAPGDVVIFKGGVHYRGNLTMKWAGEKGKPITYDGNSGTFGKGRAVLDGAEPVKGWRACTSAEECGGNPNFRKIYTALVPGDVKGLAAFTAGLVQGERMLYPSQYPKPDDPFYADKLDRFLQLKSGMSEASIADPRLAELGGAALAGGYACVYVTGNDMQFVPIASYDAGAGAIVFATKTAKPAGYYALANSLSAKVFDRPGEYVFVDKPDAQGRHQAFIWPWDNQDLSRAEVCYVARPLGVDMGVKNHYVTLQGFLIQNYQEAIRVRGADGVVVRDNEITRIRQTGFANAINASSVNDFLFAGNYAHDMPKMRTVVTHTGERAVYSGNTVVHGGRSPLVFYNIRLGRIIGNKIVDCLGMHSNGISIYVDCRDILVARNEVHNSNIAMTLQNAERIYVLDNVFTSSDAAVGLWGGTPHRNHLFVNNLFYGPARNIYVNSREVEDCVFKNNIFCGFDGYRLDGNNVLSHNLYLKRRLELGDGEMVMEDAAKVFLDVSKGDFRLQSAGPAVDTGADVSALLPRDKFPGYDFDVDFAGHKRVFGARVDIGPYEAEYPPGALDKRPPLPTSRQAATGPAFRRIAGAEPIVIKALQYSGQGGGKVEPIDPSTIGPIDFVMGWDANGHWLEYAIDAPAAGDYTLCLRYTTATDAPRQVSLGAQPVNGLESVVLKSTRGWKNYQEQTLPATVPLLAGRNVLRLTSVGGHGCNLNSLTLAAPGGKEIAISAGAFSAQGGGKVEVVPGPRWGLFSNWDAAGHWLEWTIEGAKAGKYELRIRFATLASPPRAVSLNGQPVEGIQEFQFQSTDGWRRCEEVSLPAPLVLKAGRNVIRMTSLGGGGLNLDELRLIPIE